MSNNPVKVSSVCRAMEEIAPGHLAQEWDNVGLLLGDAGQEVGKLLLCIDLTAEVLAEAQDCEAQMVIAYHPVIFKPLSRLTREACPVVWEAARRNLAVYSPHTALDVAQGGPNDMLARVLGLDETNRQPLEPVQPPGQCKVVTFVGQEDLEAVRDAAFSAGAGRIGLYDDCSFASPGTGTFLPDAHARPAVGRPGTFQRVEEFRLEVICPNLRVGQVSRAIRAAHSYEEPPVDIYPLRPAGTGGLGRVAALQQPASLEEILQRIRKGLGLEKLLVAQTEGTGEQLIQRGACCAGSCGSVYKAAASAGAQVYLTGEMRHHDALAAVAMGMTVICTGHSNSERPVLADLARRLEEQLPGLEILLSQRDADPFRIV